MSSFSLITTLMLILAAAIGGGAVALRLRLPAIVGYIAGGVLVGNIASPFFNREVVSLIADSGVTLLLFTLGIEFSFHRLRRVLGAITWPAVAQILLVLFIVLFLLLLLGFSFLPSLYLAAATSLSSTAIVVKVLSERGELETEAGEVTTGWLVVQDLAVVPLMIVLGSLAATPVGGATVGSTLRALLIGILQSGVILGLIIVLGRYGVPRLLDSVTRLKSRELFLLVIIGIVFLVGLVTYALGLSVALGAFIAGLLIAETSQNHAVFAEIRPLRDLFAVVFFVSLGLVLPLASLATSLWVIILLTVAVIFVKGGIVYTLLRYLGYHARVAFLTALSLTQVSEFGFLLSQEGMRVGALTSSHASVLVAVTFVTILVSAPLLAQAPVLYHAVYGILRAFPRLFLVKDERKAESVAGLPIADHVVICGYGRVGKYVGRALAMAGIPFLVVDYNQAVMQKLNEQGIQTVYGDPADKGVLDYAQVDHARAVVVAIPDRHTQEMVIGHALSLNRRIKIICRTHHEEDQKHLKSLGVATVIQPEFEASLAIVDRLLTAFGLPPEEIAGKVSRLKIEHGLG